MILGFVCYNASTYIPHIERDCSYTFIGVPFCDVPNDTHLFEFWVNYTRKIAIKLIPGISLYYNGYGIMHRQVKNQNMNDNQGFWNFSTYANKSLYHNIMKSFQRMFVCNS